MLIGEGKLDVSARVADLIPEFGTNGKEGITVEQVMLHTSGFPQAPLGPPDWYTREGRLEAFGRWRLNWEPGSTYEYHPTSAHWVLAEIIERLAGVDYRVFVRDRILEPLGMERTSLAPSDPAAVGYLVHPYTDSVWQEAPVDTAGWVPAGQMWGTVRDLCRWGAFLVSGDPAVLRRETLDEMRVVQAIDEHERWTSGYGLGLALRRDGERILVGHGGSMPGFKATLLVSPVDRIGAATLTNGSTIAVEELARALMSKTIEAMPTAREEWRVGEPVPAELEGVPGVWFLEGSEMVLRWRDGRVADLEITFS
jgi:CubicO group peptidase (beta-lactamase class C family)